MAYWAAMGHLGVKKTMAGRPANPPERVQLAETRWCGGRWQDDLRRVGGSEDEASRRGRTAEGCGRLVTA